MSKWQCMYGEQGGCSLLFLCSSFFIFFSLLFVELILDVLRYGFNVVAKNEEQQWTDVRFPFPYAMNGVEDCMNSIANSLDHITEKHTIKPK